MEPRQTLTEAAVATVLDSLENEGAILPGAGDSLRRWIKGVGADKDRERAISAIFDRLDSPGGSLLRTPGHESDELPLKSWLRRFGVRPTSIETLYANHAVRLAGNSEGDLVCAVAGMLDDRDTARAHAIGGGPGLDDHEQRTLSAIEWLGRGAFAEGVARDELLKRFAPCGRQSTFSGALKMLCKLLGEPSIARDFGKNGEPLHQKDIPHTLINQAGERFPGENSRIERENRAAMSWAHGARPPAPDDVTADDLGMSAAGNMI